MSFSAIAETNYITIVYSEDIKDPDKTIAKLNSKQVFGDTTEVSWDDMYLFRSISNTTLLFRAICYSVNIDSVKKNVTKKDVEDNVKDKISEPDKVTVIACGLRPMLDVIAAGFEPRP